MTFVPLQGAEQLPKVFISYAREDGVLARIMQDMLRKAGFDAWMDTERLYAGVTWRNEIEIAIREAHVLVVLVSPDARSSEYVTYEWAFALGANIPVVPVVHRDTAMHPKLAERQWLDFRQVDPDLRGGSAWDHLFAALRQLADRHAPLIGNLTRGLHAADPAGRKSAITELGKLARLPHPTALRVLFEATRSPLDDVRKAATDVLFLIDDKSVAPYLLELLSVGEHELDIGAAEALTRLLGARAITAGDERFVDRLFAAFIASGNRVDRLDNIYHEHALAGRDEGPNVSYSRRHAWETLRHLTRTIGALGPADGSRLIELITNPATTLPLREAAINALGRSGDKSAINLLRTLYTASQTLGDVEAACAIALGRLGDRDFLPELVRLLRDGARSQGHTSAVGAAIRALWQMNTPESRAEVDRFIDAALAELRTSSDSERELELASGTLERLKFDD
jgi:HEAT repeat protein